MSGQQHPKTTSGGRVRESFTSVVFWAYGKRVAMRELKNPLFRSGDKVRVTVELVRRKNVRLHKV